MKVNQKNKVLNIKNTQNQKNKENLEQIIEENTITSSINDNNPKVNENKIIVYKKITKQPELENFDTSSHLMHNIISFDQNCKDKISEQSYYCITCMQSVCTSCGAYEHKDHILIQRDNCLFYDPNFFVEISKIIEISQSIKSRKQSIKDSIEKYIEFFKNYLDEVKNSKFKEIDDFFENSENNMKNLKKNFVETKRSIENYYKRYKKFFNIDYISKENNNNSEEELLNNLDIENTIFIMNFDLMNLCDSKNLQVLDKVNGLTNKINSINENLSKNKNDIIQNINNYFNLEFENEKYEDFYYDIKTRIEKYSQIIHQFQETIADIIQKTGNIDKIKELLDIFDSKNKKNKNLIFQQNFFQNESKNTENNTPRLSSNNNEKDKKLNNSKSNNYIFNSDSKVDEKDNNLKVNICQNSNINKNKNKSNMNIFNTKSNKKINNSTNSKKDKYTFSPSKNNKFHKFKSEFNNNLSENQGNMINNNTPLSNRTIIALKFNSDDVMLDNRIIQRFFAYSLNDFYTQNICLDKMNKAQDSQINVKKKKHKTNLTNSKNKENNMKKIFTKNNINKKNLFSNYNFNKNNTEELDSNQYNVKSVAYLANYQNRYNSLKERTKPIIGTNQIQIFEPTTKKIFKKTTLLNKNEHGYSIFPDGCRHILIDNILYVTGGNNSCGNIVLSYDIISNQLTRLPNLLTEHYFHTLEYIDNFDCIICIGGENSSSCEIMDINDKKWKKLPSLNYPRANCNVFYNNITEHIYVLFGMKGNLWDKNNKNSDKIEVLNLNNIDKGWVNIDYYKSSGLDLKVNFCKTMPFTKEKLIIFGGNNARNIEEQSFYALFDMNKNEIIKVDKQTMELIKLEEKKMRIADLALTKIN